MNHWKSGEYPPFLHVTYDLWPPDPRGSTMDTIISKGDEGY